MSPIESTIATAVVEELTTHIKSTTEVPVETLAHYFGVVCQRYSFIPTQETAKRILAEVWRDIARLRFEAEQLAAATARPKSVERDFGARKPKH